MATTAGDVIDRAMRLIGSLDIGESASTDEAANGLRALNSMIALWSASEFGAYGPTSVSHTVPSGTSSLTIGWYAGADISTDKFQHIFDSYLRDSSGYDYPLAVKSLKEYGRIGDKDAGGRPNTLYFRVVYPNWTLYFDRETDAEYTLKLELSAIIRETFLLITNELNMPEEYEEAVTYNLAIRLAPEFSVVPPAAVVAIAKQGLNLIKTNNVHPVAQVAPLPFSKNVGRYDIRID